MRTTDSLSVMMGPNAGEEKGGEPQKKERNLLRTPLCFLSSVCQIRVRGERKGGEGEASERESADGPHRLTGWTNVDVFSPGSDIYS